MSVLPDARDYIHHPLHVEVSFVLEAEECPSRETINGPRNLRRQSKRQHSMCILVHRSDDYQSDSPS
jgi:hypothetical protein